MANDIFGRAKLQFGGAFAADSADISFGSNVGAFHSGVGLVTQQIGFQYQQPITRIYEVGTQLTYYIAGRPQGSANAARILGPARVLVAFYSQFGDVCKAGQNYLFFKFRAGCGTTPGAGTVGGAALTFILDNVILQSIGMSVGAQDMIINEQLSFFFTALEAFEGDAAQQA